MEGAYHIFSEELVLSCVVVLSTSESELDLSEALYCKLNAF
jgi:hypothetical protein